MSTQTNYEAVILNSYEHEGETKWRRFKIGNLKPNKDGKSFNLYIPEGITVSGRLLIQERQENPETQYGAQQ